MNPEMSVVGYCRACGKALEAASARQALGSLYCEEHAPAAAPEPGSPYAAPPPAAPIPNPNVSPGLAFILGLIPGVGAIYNGQYGKGIIHVVIAGLLLSMLDASHSTGLEPLLGMTLTAFWFYMAFEAFHTAKRRQLGQPVDEFSSLIPIRGQNAASAAAPVALIVLGVIFLLNNLGWFYIRDLLRYWPVLLIVLGAYMLYARISGDGRVTPSGEVTHERN
jgi:hypothetical protein